MNGLFNYRGAPVPVIEGVTGAGTPYLGPVITDARGLLQ
jgi:hypothetical protein